MKIHTEVEASRKLCPIMSKPDNVVCCQTETCMAWNQLHIGWLTRNYGTRYTEADRCGFCQLIENDHEE